MKKPIALWIAPPLVLLKSAAILFTVFAGEMAPRYRRNTDIFAVVFAAAAVLFYFKPKIARWLIGGYYFIAMWLGLGVIAKPGVSPKDALVGIVSAALACWLAYALLGSKATRAYLDEKRPNQTPEPTPMSVTPPAAQEPRQP